MEVVSLSAIGHFECLDGKKYDVPRQAHLNPNEGKVILYPGHNFETCLEDLNGFSHIWLLFLFNNQSWKPKVQSPRDLKKRGVFSTRSPYRPSPIGLSLVELIGIDGRELRIKNYDLLDQSKIIDIKPYIKNADSVSESRQGWLDKVSSHEIIFSKEFFNSFDKPDVSSDYQLNTIKSFVINQLEYAPIGHPNKRVKVLNPITDSHVLSYQYLRIPFQCKDNQIIVGGSWCELPISD